MGKEQACGEAAALKELILSVKIVSLFALAFFGNAQSGPGLPFFQTTTFGMFGLAANQTARLNVLNPGAASFAGKPTCSAELAFLDGDGRVLKSNTAQPVEDEKAIFLDLNRNQVSNTSERVQIRARVRIAAVPPAGPSTPSPIMPGSVCSLFPTVEVFDKDTGKTTMIMTQAQTVMQSTPGILGGRRP